MIRSLFDRRHELAAILSALDAGLPVEVSGERGVGKTAVLRHLAHHPRAASFLDGIVYLPVRRQTSADLVQRLFEAFFDTDGICKPTDAEIRRGLQEKQALILLDDVHLPQPELEQVLDIAPRSAFVVTTRQRCLWGEARSVELKGLPADDAVSLLEREIERPLEAAERAAAAALCTALEGHPLRLQQAAAIAREQGMSLDVCARHLTPANLVTELMPSTDEKQRRAMLAMAALSGVPLRASHVAGIAEVTDIEPSLRVLIRRGLVVSADARHQLAAGIGNHLRRTDDLNPWANRTITYFTAWCERNRRSAAGLLEESEALVRVLQIAADARRWGEVLRVGRLLEGALIGGARWGAWAIVVEQCLAAATALGDRQAEAWARHEIGTRALCLGETGVARASLNQSITMREAIDDRGAAAASRRNLAFVVAPEPEEPRQQPITRLDDRFDLDSLTLRAEALPATRSASSKPAGLLALIALLAAVLAGFAYWVRPAQQSWSAFNVAGVGALLQRESAAPVPPPQQDRTAPREPVGQAWSEQVIATPSPATGTAAPAAVGQASGFDARGVDAAAPALTAVDTDRANILIFTPRPGSITRGGPTRLCYAVTGALHARVEPGIGEVTPSSTLTCLRVSPARTTTYALTASGRDGRQVRQQLVIVVR